MYRYIDRVSNSVSSGGGGVSEGVHGKARCKEGPLHRTEDYRMYLKKTET